MNLIPHIKIRIVFQPIKFPLHRRDVLLILYVDVVGSNCPRVGVGLYITDVVIEFALRVLVSTMVLIAMVDTNRSPHVSCETWGLFVIIGLVLGKTGELFSVSRGVGYETSEPGSTSRSGVMTASEPSALSAERIMP